MSNPSRASVIILWGARSVSLVRIRPFSFPCFAPPRRNTSLRKCAVDLCSSRAPMGAHCIGAAMSSSADLGPCFMMAAGRSKKQLSKIIRQRIDIHTILGPFLLDEERLG
eukprot:788738-Pyramimonas_sp.AAC.1